MTSLADFRRDETIAAIARGWVLRRLFRLATRHGARLFLRGGDIISEDVHTRGVHEPGLTALIGFLAASGQGDFLIDIGANIGLTSCQSGNAFRVVHMYEPNPLCCHILEVNAAIALEAGRYAIHPVGLGEREKTARLTVPKHNWGGAFVRDAGNSYDLSTLAAKDGFSTLDSAHYFEVDIRIAETASELAALFARLAEQGLRRGVIKIDVEGYEAVVLAGIAKVLPTDAEVVIVFESWDARFDMDAVLAAFGGRATAAKLCRRTPWKPHWPMPLRALALLFAGGRVPTVVATDCGGDWKGDIVLRVAAAAG